MIRRITTLLFCFFTLAVSAQQLYYIEIEQDQEIEANNSRGGSLFSVAKRSGTVVLGGLQNREGIGMFIESNGMKLIIDSMSDGLDGSKYVVLRREDGRLFYNVTPTLKAKLTPISQMQRDSVPQVDSLNYKRL